LRRFELCGVAGRINNSAIICPQRCWPMREVMNAIFFVLRGGCPWRMLPEHFPPHQTTYRWFTLAFRSPGGSHPLISPSGMKNLKMQLA
jgi:transposase